MIWTKGSFLKEWKFAALSRLKNNSIDISVWSGMGTIVLVGSSLTMQNGLHKDASCYTMVWKEAIPSLKMATKKSSKKKDHSAIGTFMQKTKLQR